MAQKEKQTTSQTEEAKTEPKHSTGKFAEKSRRLSNVLMIVGVVLLVCAIGIWGYAQYAYHKLDERNAASSKYAQLSDDGSAPKVDFDALRKENSEVVGWIEIPGTPVNYPVYQHDDNKYYLDRSADGKVGVGGQIFMDYQNLAPGMQDMQTILYGHHMRNGSMFETISHTDDQGFFDSLQTVWYVTPDASYKLVPLLTYHTQENDYDARKISFNSEQEFHDYLKGLLGRSSAKMQNAETVIDGTSHVLTLSTCNYIADSGRTIMVCVPADEVQATKQ